MFSLVFSRRYSMAHRFIVGIAEKCAVPHGHNETVTVRLEPTHPVRLDGNTNVGAPFGAPRRPGIAGSTTTSTTERVNDFDTPGFGI
jgi:hypothetical protein